MSQAASSDKGSAQRADALIARMKEARGYIYPEWEFAARQDPEFVEAYNRIYELGLGDGQHVSAKVREFMPSRSWRSVALRSPPSWRTSSGRFASVRRERSCSTCSRRAWG